MQSLQLSYTSHMQILFDGAHIEPLCHVMPNIYICTCKLKFAYSHMYVKPVTLSCLLLKSIYNIVSYLNINVVSLKTFTNLEQIHEHNSVNLTCPHTATSFW